ncbi:alpha/beta fold hydrolase [Candidatus Bipolaricaulota bacterium]
MTERIGQTITLRDGRVLGYDEYGAPDGKPIFHFHGHPGARIEWPLYGDDACARQLNARIIAVDRPGHGLSDFKPGREIIDWPDDVIEVADVLHIDRFSVLGISGGGPYAAACAFKIPERLTATAIVSGMGPAAAPGARKGLSWTYAGRSSLTRKLLLRLTAMGVQKQPEKFVSRMNEGMKGPDKELLLEKPDMASKTIEVFREAFRSGVAGAHHEAGLYSRPWGFRLQDISAQVHLWHGEQDHNVLVSVGRYVADTIPNCRARFLESEGHITVPVRYAREYLDVLAG